MRSLLTLSFRFVAAFASLAVATVILAFSRATCFFLAALRASSGMHERMLKSVIRAPMSWFHANPQGRVLNRFSADQGQLDEQVRACESRMDELRRRLNEGY